MKTPMVTGNRPGSRSDVVVAFDFILWIASVVTVWVGKRTPIILVDGLWKAFFISLFDVFFLVFDFL